MADNTIDDRAAAGPTHVARESTVPLTEDANKSVAQDEEDPNQARVIYLRKRVNSGDQEESRIDSIPLDDTEAISNSTFRCLIEDAVKVGQSVIVARMQTRDKADFRKKYFHHFYGPNLIKILFKVFQMPGQQVLQSRYHQDYPITAKNPLTNQVIVGEVDFFVLDVDQLTAKCKNQDDGSDNTWQHSTNYEATFFGSDFNYSHQQEFRFKFRSMTQDAHLLEIGLIADMIENADGNNAETGQNHLIAPSEDAAFRDFMRMMQNQVAMGIDVSHALRYVLQNRSKSLDFYGKVMAFFFLSFVMT